MEAMKEQTELVDALSELIVTGLKGCTVKHNFDETGRLTIASTFTREVRQEGRKEVSNWRVRINFEETKFNEQRVSFEYASGISGKTLGFRIDNDRKLGTIVFDVDTPATREALGGIGMRLITILWRKNLIMRW